MYLFNEAYEEMTLELVDYRLAQYRRRVDQGRATGAFTCRVFRNDKGPILKLPDRKAQPGLPLGDVDARLPDGSIWRFRFVSIACNVAHPVGGHDNALHDLLRSWFGPSAGRPGTAFQVGFTPSPDGLWVEPLGKVIELPARCAVTAFPSLRAAAGPVGAEVPDAPEPEQVMLPLKTRAADAFAVRAAGDSMDGGVDPIRDGDWLVMKYARGAGLGAVEGRVALVETEGAHGDSGYQVKRVVRDGRRWFLESDRPGAGRFEASERTRIVALLRQRVSPGDLAPQVGARLGEDALADAFGLAATPRTGRVGGHLFLFVDRPGGFVAPDRLAMRVPDRRPGETAYVLTREGPEGAWRYAGVGRWMEAEGAWALPELDHATWRALGEGRGASRRLPEGLEARARDLVDLVLARVGAGGSLEHGGKRCRIVGKAAGGGLRIDGGAGGFGERTVSVTDIAWVLAAERDVAEAGGVPDEARVNRVRYLEGTPRESTRWIDTGWALVVVMATNRRPLRGQARLRR